jgi:hypothetical protein
MDPDGDAVDAPGERGLELTSAAAPSSSGAVPKTWVGIQITARYRYLIGGLARDLPLAARLA